MSSPVVWTLAVRVLQTTLTFAIGFVLARVLTKDQFGLYAYIFSLLTVTTLVLQAGVPQLLTREIAALRMQNQVGNIRYLYRVAFAFIGGLSAVAIIGWTLVAFAGVFDGIGLNTIALGLPAIFFLASTRVLGAATRGFGSVLSGQLGEAIVQPVVQLGLLLVVFWSVSPSRLSVEQALAALSCAALLATVAAWFIFRAKSATARAAALPEVPMPWGRAYLRLSSLGWFAALSAQLAIIILGSVALPEEVADFRVAAQTSALIPLGLTAMNAIVAPAMSESHTRGEVTRLQQAAHRSCAVSLAVALPVSLPMLLFTPAVIEFVFGAQYLGAVAALRILIAAQLVNAAVGSVGPLLIATRNEREVLLLQIFYLVILMGGSLVLIPSYGHLGSALAVGVAMTIWNVSLVVRARTLTGITSLPSFRNLAINGLRGIR